MSTPSPPSAARVGTKYRTYKRATDKLAGWLATTAEKLGVESVVKLKKDSSGASPSHALTIAQFSAITDFIVEATPKIEVPLDVVHLAQTAYQYRQETAALLRGVDLESDKRHEHVINIIGKVFRRLNTHYEASKVVQKQPVLVEGDNEKCLAASFNALDLEPLDSDADTSEGGPCEDGPPIQMSKNKKDRLLKKKKKAKRAAKPAYILDEDEDPYFVLVCLLSDLKSMRSYVKDIWGEYKAGKVDLVTVSLTTNAAFDIIRTYEEDFPAVSCLLADYSKTMRLILSRNLDEADKGLALFLSPCRDLVLHDEAHIKTVSESLTEIPEVAELIFANAFYFLNGPRHILVQRKRGKMVAINEKHDPFGSHQPDQDRDSMTTMQRLEEDVQILAAYAKQVYQDKPFPGMPLDEFTKQWLDEFAKTGQQVITLAQAFGAQLYLDIQHVLRRDCSRGVFDLWTTSVDVKISFEDFDKYSPKEAFRVDPHFNDALQRLTLINKVLATNILSPVVSVIVEDTNIRGKHVDSSMMEGYIRDKPKVSPFLRIHPLLCGIILFTSIHHFRDASVLIADLLSSVMLAGQIYHSCQMQREHWKSISAADPTFGGSSFEKSLNKDWRENLEWKDMDYLFALYGRASFFHDDLPKTTSDLGRKAWSWERLNSLEFLKDIVKKKLCTEGHIGPILTAPKLGENSQGGKFAKTIFNYEPIAITHRLYFSKYTKHESLARRGDAFYEWTLETLQALLEVHLQKKSHESSKRKGKGRGKKGYTARITLKQADGDVSQVTILRTLKEAIQSESRALCFDFLAFHNTCFAFLQTMREKTACFLCASPRPYKDDSTLHLYISEMQKAINTPQAGSKLSLPLGPPFSEDIFTNEGHVVMDQVVEDLIDAHGSKHTDILEQTLHIKPADRLPDDYDTITSSLEGV